MEVLHLYPILYLNITVGLTNLDPVLEEAAANLGAGRWCRFFRCTLPLILPGLFSGSTIVFIWSFAELGTPLMFDYHTVMPVQIFWDLKEVAENAKTYALVVVMLTVALGVYVLGRYFFGGHAYEMHAKASVASTTRRLSGTRAFAAFGVFTGITLVAILPNLGVVFSSLSVEGSWCRSVLSEQWTLAHYQNAVSHELAMQPIANSLYYAIVAVGLCLIVGLAIACLVVRVRLKGAMLLDGLAIPPLAVPGLIIAFGYVAMSFRWPFGPGDPLHRLVSALGLDPIGVLGQSPNPIPLIIIGYAVRRLPTSYGPLWRVWNRRRACLRKRH